jgi:hypothetical protein
MVEDPTAETPDYGFLDKIRLWLGLDESTFQALMNTVLITFCSLSLFVTFVVSTNRKRSKDGNNEVGFVNENWVDLDDDEVEDDIQVTPVVSLEENEESSIEEASDVEDTTPAVGTVVIDDELDDESTSSRSARATRRERRAVEAEMKQVMDDMKKAMEESGLPPLPVPGELPPLPGPGELPPLPAPGELPPLPAPGELPPLPAPGELPPLPAPDDLPPLPDLPAPEIPVTCGGCESTFTARANKARRVKCPLCGETVKL